MMGRFAHEGRLGLVVDRGRIVAREDEIAFGAEHGGHVLRHLAHASLDQVQRLGGVGAHRAAQFAGVGDDVDGLARPQRGHGNDGRLKRLLVAADDGLEGFDHLAGRRDWIDGQVRHGGMAPLAADGHVELAVGCQHRARRRRETALRDARHVVHAEHGFHRKFLEQAVTHHLARAAAAFFGGLEDQVDGAVEIAVARQVLGRAQQHGGMAVVAAAMHLAGDGRTVGGVTQLLHVQRVHVGAQADHWPLASRHRAHHAGLAQSAVNDSAGPFELPGHQVSRAEFTEGGFRMRVQIAAPFAHLMQQVGADGRLDDGHGAESP
ncbi:hypothetical protein G6F68_011857 [Rhizopus microsporus]|nr:hypothetical protein G6F68_011857 [Rhizopus microsporus]